jgi:hypothetical protein
MISHMTYDEFRRQIGKVGLTMHAFADLVKMNKISLSNYKQGGCAVTLGLNCTSFKGDGRWSMVRPIFETYC